MTRGISIIFDDCNEALQYLTLFVKNFIKDKQVYTPVFDKLLIDDNENEIIDITTVYTSNKFLSLLSSTRQLLFLELFAFYQESSSLVIADYDNFLNSDYTIAIMCSDSVYFDIYIKDKRILEEAYKLALAMNFESLEYITEENDFRTAFSVW